MEQCFVMILNNAITVSVLIVVIVLLRFLLKAAPKRLMCFLWIIVAIKLIVPIQIESVFSLIPNNAPVPISIATEKEPALDSGMKNVDKAINPVIQKHFSPTEEASK